MTATDKALHSANALACVAGCIAAADATAMGGAGMGLIMSLREVWRRGKTPDDPLVLRTRQSLDAELAKAHLTPKDRAAFHYAIGTSDLSPDRIIALNRDPGAIAQDMATALANTDADAMLHNTFCTIVANVLTETLADPATADELASAFQTAVLESQSRQESQLEVLHAKMDRLIAEKEDVARAFHIKEGMLIGLARNYADTASDFESALAGLQLALETAAKDQERDALPSNLGEAVDSIVAQVAALNEADRLDEADDLLTAEMARLDAEIEEKKAAQARIIDKAISQAVFNADATALADRTLRRIQLDAPSPKDQFHRLRAEWEAQYEEGLRFGVPFALAAAIGLAQRCVEIAPTPYFAAMAQNDLGNALQTQGTRTEGPAGARLLAQAVTAYRAALEVRTRTEQPVAWAMTQNNLAAALKTKGIRTEGPAGADLLAQAVTAYRAALEVYTRTEHRVGWAMTQNNLAIALGDQGTRTEGPAGADLLAQAVTAYGAALDVYTRPDHPVGWATTQNNLGNALSNQGTRTEGLAGADLLAQAVTAYRAALEVRTRAEHPVDWAGTQNNLAVALKTKGIRTEGPAGADLLEQAVTAYRAALEVRTRAEHPVDWATTQGNIAIAHFYGAEHDTTQDPRPDLDAALAAVTLALDVYDPVHMSYDHANATRLHDLIQAALDALQSE